MPPLQPNPPPPQPLAQPPVNPYGPYQQVQQAQHPGADTVAAVAATNPALADFVTTMASMVEPGIALTQVKALAALLRAAIDAGRSAEDLGRDIDDSLRNPPRAQRIAQTETSHAIAQGARHFYRDHGVTQTIWITAADEKVCPACMANGQSLSVPIGHPYPSGVLFPPQHPNCRCTVTPADWISVPDFAAIYPPDDPEGIGPGPARDNDDGPEGPEFESGSGKMWTSHNDEDVCELCSGNVADGPLEPGETFTSGALVPPAHKGCRCSIIPVAFPSASAGKSWGDKREKVSKVSVHYRAATGSRHCGSCGMFDAGTCDLVAGKILSGDVCDKWIPQAAGKSWATAWLTEHRDAHGRWGEGGAATPQAAHDAWAALTPQQRDAQITADPAGVGWRDGLPAADRDKANRISLAAAAASSVPATRDGAAAVSKALDLGSPSYLLGFDSHGSGHAIVAIGNPDTAKTTVTYVPGVGASLQSAADETGRAAQISAAPEETSRVQRVGDGAHDLDPEPGSAIWWMGYDVPQLGEDIVRQHQLVHASTRRAAQAGAPKLAAFQAGLRAAHDGPGREVVLGHSYGSLVSGLAAREHGMRPDDLIFIGSPGTGSRNVSDLGMPAGHVWAAANSGDPVPKLAGVLRAAGFGGSPADPAYGARVFSAEGGPTGFAAHSAYWDPGSMSLKNLSAITAAKYANVIVPSTVPESVKALTKDDIARGNDALAKLDKKAGSAQTLREYWTHHAHGGPTHFAGADAIKWGTPGDFMRCVSLLTPHLGHGAYGYCNLRHHDALGYYPATHAAMDRGKSEKLWHFNPAEPRSPHGQWVAGAGPLGPLEDVLHKDGAVQDEQAKYLQAIPQGVQQKMKDHGVHITITADPDVAKFLPGGKLTYTPTVPGSREVGAYDRPSKHVYVSAGIEVGEKTSGQTLLHEAAHAADDSLGMLSDSRDWKKISARIFEAGQSGYPLLGHFDPEVDGQANARQEQLAELTMQHWLGQPYTLAGGQPLSGHLQKQLDDYFTGSGL